MLNAYPQRKSLLLGALLAILVGVCRPADSEGEVEVFPLGGTLWPEGYKPDQSELPPGTDQSQLNEEVDRKLRLFIPKTPNQVRVTPVAPTVTPKHEIREVSVEFLTTSEKTGQGQFLTDPLHLLNETPAEDLRRLLEYHSGESNIRAHVLVLNTDEKLPQVLDLSKMAGGELAQGLACLIAYPLGEPWRVRMFMSRGVTEFVPAEYLQSLAQACVQDSMQVTDQVEQLQRFAIQLSIRLIWLERAYPSVRPKEITMVALPVSQSEGQDIQEVIASEPSILAEHFWEKWFAHSDRVIRAGYLVGGVLAALVFLLVLIRRIRRRNRSTVWMLPEPQVQQRLGGPHCGGGGASINYG